MRKIVLTGGGTAGHVTPNIALVPKLKEADFDISYIGTYDGIERKLIEEIGIPYYGISSGKLRRYLDIKNFTDPFRIIKGYFEAKQQLKSINPDVVFSKGGFVTVPVVLAAKQCKIPVIIHESDMSPGLANKLSIPAATKVCYSFPETASQLSNEKSVLTGLPIREELLLGNKLEGLKLTGFTANKPVILVTGGSLGSAKINASIRSILPILLEDFQIIHICGKGHMDRNLTELKGYKQFEYVKGELKDLFALSDLVVSRAGANFICEILALRKPNLLIPLSRSASRGDQILNANSFQKQGFSKVLEEESLTNDSLQSAINEVYNKKNFYIDAMMKSGQSNAVDIILELIKEVSK